MDDNYIIQNAIIEGISLNDGERGLLTAYLNLNYGGSGQGFGGFSLYLPPSFSHHKILSPAGHFIWRCMEIAGSTSWDGIKGRTIRVKSNWSKVKAIGHIIKDDWFDPSVDFANLREAA